jgi:hypothetical protein
LRGKAEGEPARNLARRRVGYREGGEDGGDRGVDQRERWLLAQELAEQNAVRLRPTVHRRQAHVSCLNLVLFQGVRLTGRCDSPTKKPEHRAKPVMVAARRDAG